MCGNRVLLCLILLTRSERHHSHSFLLASLLILKYAESSREYDLFLFLLVLTVGIIADIIHNFIIVYCRHYLTIVYFRIHAMAIQHGPDKCLVYH